MGTATTNYAWVHITTTTSQIVDGNPGVIFGSVIANTLPSGTGGTLAIYDDVAATPANQIANINMSAFANNAPIWLYNVVMSRGIFIVWTQGGTTVGDLTITFV